MLGLGTTEVVIIVVVALIFLGPKKLPELARGLGKAMAEFRRAGNEIRDTIETEVVKAEKEASKPARKVEIKAKEKAAQVQSAPQPATESGGGDSPQEPAEGQKK